MFGYIGYGLPLSYLGPALTFIAFAITVLITAGLRDIVSKEEVPW